MTHEEPPKTHQTGSLAEETILEGRYRIDRRLGKGGMGAVYLAHDQRLDITVAVKEMSTAYLKTDEEQARASQAFHEEAKLLARLAHPNLPRVTDHFSEADKEYLVMEYVPGDTLAQIMSRKAPPWSLSDVMNVAIPLTTVLHYLHTRDQPIIFRDLKPANIIRTPDGIIKLIDFGIARLFKPGQSHDTQAFGTIGYSAPEQYGKGQTDARSDVYSLAILIHQLASGHDPIKQPFNVPEARHLNTNIPEQFSDVLATAISHDPSERFSSMVALRRALETASNSSQPLNQTYLAPQQRPAPQQHPNMSQPFSGQMGYGPPTPQRGLNQPPSQPQYSPPTPQRGLNQAPSGGYYPPKQMGIAQQPSMPIQYQPPQKPIPMYARQSFTPQAKTTFLAQFVFWIGILGVIASISTIITAATMGEDGIGGAAGVIVLGGINFIISLIATTSSKTHTTKKGRRHAIFGMLLSCLILILGFVALAIALAIANGI